MSLFTTLTALANAIRSKTAITGTMTIDQMTDAIVNMNPSASDPTVNTNAEFYQCASYTAPSEKISYDHVITVYDTNAGQSDPRGNGIYYPVDLQVSAEMRIYKRADELYTLSAAVCSDDNSFGRIVLTKTATGKVEASTPPLPLEGNIWDNWEDYWFYLFGSSAATEEDSWDMPDYWGRVVDLSAGNMLTVSGAGSELVNGNYARVSEEGVNTNFSSGSYDAWISENGKSQILFIDDWIEDENGELVLGLVIYTSSAQYEMITPGLRHNDRITADDIAQYTWQTAVGTTPLPAVSNTPLPSTGETIPASWSGYKMFLHDGSGVFVSGAGNKKANGIYKPTVSDKSENSYSQIYKNENNYIIKTRYSSGDGDYQWQIFSPDSSNALYNSYWGYFKNPADVTTWQVSHGTSPVPNVTRASTGYYPSATAAKGLPVNGFIPEAGKIYSSDTVWEIARVYNG